MSTLSRAERAEARAKVAECQAVIRDAKRDVVRDLIAYKQAAVELKRAAMVHSRAERAYDRRPSGKNEVKYNAAKSELLRCVKNYNAVAQNINSAVDAVHDNYEIIKTLMTEINMKKAAAAANEYDKFSRKTTNMIDRIQEPLQTVDIPAVEEEEEVPEVVEELPVFEEIAPVEEEPVFEIEPIEEEPVVEEYEEEEEEEEEYEEPAPAAPAPQPTHQQYQPSINNFYPPMYPQMPQYQPTPSYIPYPFPVPSFGQTAPAAPAPEAPQPKVAPVTIDVSNIVDKAVADTMKKFTAVLEKKIEEYVASIVLPDPVVVQPVIVEPAPAPVVEAAPVVAPVEVTETVVVSKTRGAEEIAALEEKILEDEQFVIDKLTAMLAKVQELADSMAAASEKYYDIASKQSATNDLQKQTNDMQRHTYREQQGIQVSQRVVGQDQAAVASDQIILAEEQKAMVERQAAVNESQLNVIDTQAVVIETQVTIEEAMKSVMQAQKDIIRTQQTIINNNNKTVTANAELADKQAEVLALQKEALANQKQMLREQKAAVKEEAPRKKRAPKAPVEEPVAEVAPVEAPVVEEAPVAVEAPANEQ